MKKEQILKLAISKAVKNGWTYFGGDSWTVENERVFVTAKGEKWGGHYLTFIFGHSFAKAFAKYILKDSFLTLKLFGNSEDIKKFSRAGILEEMAKERLLVQMVLEKDPILYLEKYLKAK